MPSDHVVPHQTFARTQVLRVAGAQIACHRHGSGPAVICIHATGHGSRDFLKLAHALGGTHEFIALDWPGQGESPREVTKASADRYAELLDGVIDQLGLLSYIVLGNSISGAAAIIHAAARPDKVRALILCNPGGLQPVNLIARLYCNHMARFFAKGARGDKTFGDKFRRYYEKTILQRSEAEWRREEIIQSGYQSAPVLQEAWESFSKPDADIRHLAPRLSMPVLYAWARGDKAVAWSRSKKAALAAPDCEFKLFRGGHCAFLEDPDKFRKVFLDFTGRLAKG